MMIALGDFLATSIYICRIIKFCMEWRMLPWDLFRRRQISHESLDWVLNWGTSSRRVIRLCSLRSSGVSYRIVNVGILTMCWVLMELRGRFFLPRQLSCFICWKIHHPHANYWLFRLSVANIIISFFLTALQRLKAVGRLLLHNWLLKESVTIRRIIAAAYHHEVKFLLFVMRSVQIIKVVFYL